MIPMTTISALVIVYHEEGTIERCLTSLQGAVDEIIVIHDGPCNDQTVAIASRFTKKIFIGERRGMMEFHLIDGIIASQGEWILRIDADETLSFELQKHIKKLASTTKYDAYSFVWPLWDGKKAVSRHWPYKLALYNKRSIAYLENPHTNFLVKGKIKKTPYVLEHRPSIDMCNFTVKHKRWIAVEAKTYLLPTSKKRYYALGRKELMRIERKRKAALRFPFLFFVMHIYHSIRMLADYPLALFQKGPYRYLRFRFNYYTALTRAVAKAAQKQHS